MLKNEFKKNLVDYLLSEKFFDKSEIGIKDFDEKFSESIKLINDNAPVKIILEKKNDKEILIIFNEIVDEIKKIELEKKIASLEEKVSINLDEKLYSELLNLRNQLKGG